MLKRFVEDFRVPRANGTAYRVKRMSDGVDDFGFGKQRKHSFRHTRIWAVSDFLEAPARFAGRKAPVEQGDNKVAFGFREIVGRKGAKPGSSGAVALQCNMRVLPNIREAELLHRRTVSSHVEGMKNAPQNSVVLTPDPDIGYAA
jgi:hypothetical protein